MRHTLPSKAQASAKLDKLRQSIGKLDEKILGLIAERMRLARIIGDIKHDQGLPIKDYQVEKDVISRSRAKARSLGLSEELAEASTRLLIHHAVKEQSHVDAMSQQGQSRTLQKPSTAQRVLIAGGRGRMGGWLSEFFDSFGYQVSHFEPKDAPHSSINSERDPKYSMHHDWLTAAASAEVIVIAAPISASAGLLLALSRAADKTKALVFDICSLKSPLLSAIDEARMAGIKICSIHPMFGPDANYLAGRNIVLCDCGDAEAIAATRRLFASTTAHLSVVPLARHDELMAYVLGLAHMTNLIFAHVLAQSGSTLAELEAFASTTFRAQLGISSAVSQENPDLYFEIQAKNIYTPAMLAKLEAALKAFATPSLRKEREPFKAEMDKVRRYLAPEAQLPPARDTDP